MAENYRPSLDDPDAWVPYRYHPSRTAAIVCVVAFSITTFLHIYQAGRKKAWFLIPLIVGGLCMYTPITILSGSPRRQEH